jgi:hypothetical protein
MTWRVSATGGLTSVVVDAPREGRVRSRINGLLRQLGDAPNDLRVEVAYPNARETTSALLGQARVEPEPRRRSWPQMSAKVGEGIGQYRSTPWRSARPGSPPTRQCGRGCVKQA